MPSLSITVQSGLPRPRWAAARDPTIPGASDAYGSLSPGGSGRSTRASAHAAAALMELLLDSRFACRGRGNGAASTLGTRARSDLRCAVGSLAPRRGHPRLACDVAAHLLHQRRGGHASLPACSGVRARMLTAGGSAHCPSLESARLLRLPTAVHERSCLLTQPPPSLLASACPSLSLSLACSPPWPPGCPPPAAMDGLVDTVVSAAFVDSVRARLLLLVAP